MAISENSKFVRFTPTAWKWYLGAAAFVFIYIAIPGAPIFLLFLAGFFTLQGLGKLSWIQIDQEGFTYRQLWKVRRYRWPEVTDFKVKAYRVNAFQSVKGIAFSRVDRANTLMDKVSRFVSGGTEWMPTLGMPAEDLLRVLREYATQKTNPTPAQILGATAKGRGKAREPKRSDRDADARGHQRALSPKPKGAPISPLGSTTAPSQSAQPRRFGRTESTSTPLVQEGGWGPLRRNRSELSR